MDPLGLDWVNDAANFSAGMGDTISFGLTRWVRQKLGSDSVVNKCSGWYSGGEWAGIAHSVALGGAYGLRAAGTKAAGQEFSHWIPARLGGPRSTWNGNYVSPSRHYYQDPYRYPSGWQNLGDKWNPALQQLDRIPNVYKGAAGGAGYGSASSASNDCRCQ
jgi:hypothetical protein